MYNNIIIFNFNSYCNRVAQIFILEDLKHGFRVHESCINSKSPIKTWMHLEKLYFVVITTSLPQFTAIVVDYTSNYTDNSHDHSPVILH